MLPAFKITDMIDAKIKELREITSNWLIVEFYTHTNADMYKIKNEFTNHNEEKLVLCEVTDGIEKALDLAIELLSKKKQEFFA